MTMDLSKCEESLVSTDPHVSGNHLETITEDLKFQKGVRTWTMPTKELDQPYCAASGTTATDMTTRSALQSNITSAIIATTFALSDIATPPLSRAILPPIPSSPALHWTFPASFLFPSSSLLLSRHLASRLKLLEFHLLRLSQVRFSLLESMDDDPTALDKIRSLDLWCLFVGDDRESDPLARQREIAAMASGKEFGWLGDVRLAKERSWSRAFPSKREKAIKS